MTTVATRRPAKLAVAADGIAVPARDRPRFFAIAERAAEKHDEPLHAEARFARFEQTFLTPLHQWCVQHVGQIRGCYIPPPGLAIQVFIVTTATRFDFDLAEEVAALELRLADAGWYVSIMQLPNSPKESLAAFFNADGALEVYADGEPAQG